MNRLVLAITTLALASCATTGTQAADTAKPVMEKMAVSNILPFDVAACGFRSVPLANPTEELIQGALLSLGPAFQECFVNAKTLDGAPLQAGLKVTLGADVTTEVTGTGVSASGKECLLAVAKRLPFKPLEANAKPVAGEVPVQPGGKSVVFGLNAASDAAGAIRLAQPSFCGCYAELGTKPPPLLVARLVLSKDKPAEVVLDPNDMPTVSACVTERLKTVTLPEGQVQFSYQFLLKNSYAETPSPGAPAALQFQQLDGIRAQKTADVLLAVGSRVPAAKAYDALVAKYKATKPEKSWTLIGELKSKCAAVVTADDVWLQALKALLNVYDSSLKIAQDEKAKEPAWSPVEDALTQQLNSTRQEFARVEGQKKSDEGACPKSK
jgi:hypothetical protein